MTGYCTECGRPILKTGRCKADHRPAAPIAAGEAVAALQGGGHAPAGASTALPVGAPPRAIALPKASGVRRLGATGIEYMVYLVALWFAIALSPMTALVSGVVGPLFVAGLLAARDLRGGAYSLSKRLAGQRVVDARTGVASTTAQALGRNSYYLVLLLVMALPGFEFLAVWPFKMLVAIDVLLVLVNPAGRRLGDFIAGTQVVAERR